MLQIFLRPMKSEYFTGDEFRVITINTGLRAIGRAGASYRNHPVSTAVSTPEFLIWYSSNRKFCYTEEVVFFFRVIIRDKRRTGGRVEDFAL